MTALINASTSSGVVVTSDTSGSLAFQSNGTTIMTVASTGVSTQVGAPAFSAYQTSATSLTAGAWTKITFDTEQFDTNNNFASSTFTPTVAGYYQINAQIQYNIASVANANIRIYKNGSAVVQGNYLSLASQGYPCPVVSGIIYCNGSTDFIEIYGNIGTNCSTLTSLPATLFSGAMIRSA